MTKTILFDLDGTLLPMDTDRFVHAYMKALAGYAGRHVAPDMLVNQVLASTHVMISNADPSLTNAQVFAADFFPKVGRTEAELMPVFDAFYRERFPALRETVTGLPGLARRVVKAAVDRGYEIALATNPLFPKEAIWERMRWVEIDDLPWRLVTTYEEAHACKPQPGYFQEVLDRLGRRPEECIMVGNDVDEDGVAARLGMRLFIVTDYLINRSGSPLPEGMHGSLAELANRLADGSLP